MKLNSETQNPNVRIPEAIFCRVIGCLVGVGIAFCGISAWGQGAAGQVETGQIRIVAVEGTVELMPSGANTWVITQTNQFLNPGDQLRTEENSRVTILWSDKSVVPLGPLTQIEVLAPNKPNSLPGLDMIQGVLSFFHRDTPGRIRVLTHGANASIEGTEFVMRVSEVNGMEHDILSVLDGKVLVSNPLGSLLLTNNQEAVVESGRAPVRSPGFIANNLLQWCFYYPAVLDLNDLSLTTGEQRTLAESLDAYRAGDLLAALAKYPKSGVTASDSVRIYHAALLLSVGQVEQTETELFLLPADQTNNLGRVADSLRTLIAAVKRQPRPSSFAPRLATEFLADSYYEQSRAKGDESLSVALALAQQAAALSPQFGFAWARVAELEFSFGRTRPAIADLDRSLDLSPRNAEALSLKGFLLAAQNRVNEATSWFDSAIAMDGGLGNAWLGRGLCRIRIGHTADGQRDLLIAVASEPQRSLLRSYLAKGFSNFGQDALANKEIAIALRLDPGDPTAWLYSALIKQQENRINGAIKDMEMSQSLNDNRQLFRSRMLLDQDNAVRSVNLAKMYEDAGMDDVAVREAAKAVTYDYDNASAHLFLSDSYNALRDPTGFNLRYDTAWFNELLLANLLAPVGAGRLSQTLSSQEYSKLFESDGIGIANVTSWRTDNQLVQQVGQFGQYHNTSWAGDFEYQHNSGVRPNNQFDNLSADITAKQQLTPSDTVLGMAQFENYHSGDNRQYYNYYTPLSPTVLGFDPTYEYAEHQDPTLVGGYQHEWAPGIRTLLLGTRLDGAQRFSSSEASELSILPVAPASAFPLSDFDVGLHDRVLVYSAEISQIIQEDKFTLVAGGRWQGGQFSYSDSITNPALASDFFLATNQSFSSPFQRLDAYGYLTVEPIDNFWLTGGFAYDDMKYPANFRSLPQSAGTDERHLPAPKAALVWSPVKQVTVRGIYSHSLGGVSLDDTYTLEPTELAGFVQSYRSVMPESIVGSLSAEDVELQGLALDLKFAHGTYAGLEARHTTSRVHQTAGDLLAPDDGFPVLASSTPQDLSYNEESFLATLNQLLPDGFVAGISYALTRSELKIADPDIPSSVYSFDEQSAYLHQIDAYLLFNHRSGLFARFDANGYLQRNIGYDGGEPGDDFVQLNIQGGWRFFHRRAQILIGVLNLTGQNYHLNPLTEYSELPRSRVFVAQLNFVF